MEYLRLPHAVLATLADRCGQLGEPGVSALRETGRVTGTLLFDGLGAEAEQLDPGAFWSALDARVRQLNLGHVQFEPLDEGLAVVAWYRMPETGSDGTVERATSGCHLTTGLLGGLLGRAAGQPSAAVYLRTSLPLVRQKRQPLASYSTAISSLPTRTLRGWPS